MIEKGCIEIELSNEKLAYFYNHKETYVELY